MTSELIDGPELAEPDDRDLTPKSPARDVVHAYMADQVAAILGREAAARQDEPDAVHKMRVGTRRLRSALGTFRPLVDRDVTDPIRDELKWIAGELGGARDAEVLRERLIEHIGAEPGDLVMGPIAARIEADLRSDHRQAHDQLVAALDSERYARLGETLRTLINEPPWTELADGPADEVLTRRVWKSYRRVKDLVDAEPAELPVEAPEAHSELGSNHDHWLHEIRKDAKRLRYAAESVEPAFGAPAKELAAAAENLQEVLGEHQDSVVSRELLRDLAVRVHLDGGNAFSIGRLHALEQVRADESERAFPGAWKAVRKTKPRAWLRN
jgi:CHAD domain-containing protein